MKLTYLLAALCTVSLLSSCDPSGDETYYVNNNTGKAIYLHTSQENRVDTIAAWQTASIVHLTGIGKGDEARPDDGLPFTISYIKQDTASCKKDYRMYKHWHSEELGKHSRKYTLSISSEDF